MKRSWIMIVSVATICLVFNFIITSMAAPKTLISRRVIEYKVVILDSAAQLEFDAYGKEGWELVTTYNYASNVYAVLKR